MKICARCFHGTGEVIVLIGNWQAQELLNHGNVLNVDHTHS